MGETSLELYRGSRNHQSSAILLEVAITQGTNPWSIMSGNELTASWEALPGDTLHLPGDDPGPGALPDNITLAIADDLPVIQGQTISVKILPLVIFPSVERLPIGN